MDYNADYNQGEKTTGGDMNAQGLVDTNGMQAGTPENQAQSETLTGQTEAWQQTETVAQTDRPQQTESWQQTETVAQTDRPQQTEAWQQTEATRRTDRPQQVDDWLQTDVTQQPEAWRQPPLPAQPQVAWAAGTETRTGQTAAGATMNAQGTQGQTEIPRQQTVWPTGSGFRPQDTPRTGMGGSAPPGGGNGGGFVSSHGSAANHQARSGVISLKRSTAIMIAIIMVIVCASAAVGGGFLAVQLTPVSGGVAGEKLNLNVDPNGEVTTTEAVAKKVGDSVVGITSTYTIQSNNPFFGGSQSYESGGVGTGMIVDKNGYILTNSHVVLDGAAEKINVLLSDGKTVEAKVLWYDASIDLAILKIDAKGLSLSPVELGDSDKVPIGSYAAAIGNPLGLEFNNSVTSGVISGLNRAITASSETKTTRMEGLIQVDAAINSGNSGGPLLNSKGEVIGVNTAKASAEGMGFAIPINTAKPIIEKVLKTGNFERVYMGVSAANAADIAEQYPKLNLKTKNGAFITEVSIGSPADEAGLLMKDVITAVDKTKISTSADLIKALLNYSAGDVVNLTYVRDGKEHTIKIKLASQKDAYGQQESNDSGSNGNNGSGINPYGGSNPYGGGSGDNSEEIDPFGMLP
jgi:S1-C subfamily serine protease